MTPLPSPRTPLPATGAGTAVDGPPRPWIVSWPGLALGCVLVLAWRGSGGSWAALVSAEARSSAVDFARGFWPPAHDAALLGSLARPLGETVAIALLGMTLAVALGMPLAVAAVSTDVFAACGARPGAGARTVHGVARAILAFMRAVPEMVWALLFVRAVGLGPPAGVLAIGIGYGGVVGKVFADTLEAVPRASAEALASAGARPGAAFALGIVPPGRPLLVSYTLYRLDCALRASAVLGLVGAGGIGQQVELSLKMLRYDEVATYVLVLFALVATVDLLSQHVRRRVEASATLFPPSRARVVRAAAALAAFAAALAAGAWILDLAPAAFLSRQALVGMIAFARALWPPDLAPRVLLDLGPAVLQTLSMSILGTALAAAGGLVLAYVAAQPLRRAAPHHGARASELGLRAAAVVARTVMNLGRTLPELLWALLLVLAIGLGPFAGALALGIHTAGVLGRLYFEALEEVPPAPAAALHAAGASRLGTALHAVLPQVFPQLVTYTLYRWEVNIRASAVLGVVGAGGIGRDLKLALSWFDYPRVATLVLAILVVVIAVDSASASIRKRILRGPAGRAARSLLHFA